MTKCFISCIVAAEDCSGAFMTMTMEPIMQTKHPVFPTKLSRSFKKMADKMVVITTDSAPNGVTRMASTNA